MIEEGGNWLLRQAVSEVCVPSCCVENRGEGSCNYGRAAGEGLDWVKCTTRERKKIQKPHNCLTKDASQTNGRGWSVGNDRKMLVGKKEKKPARTGAMRWCSALVEGTNNNSAD